MVDPDSSTDSPEIRKPEISMAVVNHLARFFAHQENVALGLDQRIRKRQGHQESGSARSNLEETTPTRSEYNQEEDHSERLLSTSTARRSSDTNDEARKKLVVPMSKVKQLAARLAKIRKASGGVQQSFLSLEERKVALEAFLDKDQRSHEPKTVVDLTSDVDPAHGKTLKSIEATLVSTITEPSHHEKDFSTVHGLASFMKTRGFVVEVKSGSKEQQDVEMIQNTDAVDLQNEMQRQEGEYVALPLSTIPVLKFWIEGFQKSSVLSIREDMLSTQTDLIRGLELRVAVSQMKFIPQSPYHAATTTMEGDISLEASFLSIILCSIQDTKQKTLPGQSLRPTLPPISRRIFEQLSNTKCLRCSSPLEQRIVSVMVTKLSTWLETFLQEPCSAAPLHIAIFVMVSKHAKESSHATDAESIERLEQFSMRLEENIGIAVRQLTRRGRGQTVTRYPSVRVYKVPAEPVELVKWVLEYCGVSSDYEETL